MRTTWLTVALLVTGTAITAQEREVPKDSERISIPGCARGRTFIVGERPEHEPVRSNVAPGRRFRLNGPKKVLEEIKTHESYMVEVTGLVRKAQLGDPGGVTIAGGRVRIGGQVPRAGVGDVTREPMNYNEVVMDVESWRQLEPECRNR